MSEETLNESALVSDLNVSTHHPEEDEDEQAIQALAERLAPALEEFDALLAQEDFFLAEGNDKSLNASTSSNNKKNNNDHDSHNASIMSDEDSSLQDELQHLADAEILLRQELEFAHDFGAIMSSPMMMASSATTQYDPPPLDWNEGEPSKKELFPATTTNHDAEDTPALKSEETNGADMNDPVPIATTTNKDNNLEESNGENEATSNDSSDNEAPSTQTAGEERPPKEGAAVHSTPTTTTRNQYTLLDHSHYLQIQTERRGGWYFLRTSSDAELVDYLIPAPDVHLDKLYVGLISGPSSKIATPMSTPQKKNPQQRLPLRTVTMQMRPDVLVGAVMDAIVYALVDDDEDDDTIHPQRITVTKRQGGHLILTLGQELELDFQMVTYKGGTGPCRRVLLVRFFYHECMVQTILKNFKKKATLMTPPPTAAAVEQSASKEEEEERPGEAEEDPLFLPDFSDDASNVAAHEEALRTNLKLRQAAALVQKMESSKKGSSAETFFAGSSFWSNRSNRHLFSSKESMQDAIAQQLLTKHKPCISVANGILTLPALSKQDWPWICFSYKFLRSCWDELQDRDLTFASLQVAPFGQFPALTTLDVHFCSQLRRTSREQMIVSLLRSASELEQYAREAEYACANLIQVVKPTFEQYGINAPSLPQPLPLSAYPLDYVPHQDVCPPWGQKVMEAMNEITALSSGSDKPDDDRGTSFARAQKAVQLILDAFQRQHDEEQSARLGRKNVQVMDRLAKMQAHKQTSLDILKSCSTPTAIDASQQFHKQALRAQCELPPEEQVPLFKCSIMLKSGATGTLFITSTQLLCVTQWMPILGSTQVKLWDLNGLVLELKAASNSLLNPLPAGISVQRGGREVILMRPSFPAARLLVFIELVQAQLVGEQGGRSNATSRAMYGDVVTPVMGDEDGDAEQLDYSVLRSG